MPGTDRTSLMVITRQGSLIGPPESEEVFYKSNPNAPEIRSTIPGTTARPARIAA
jgi:hypothetical protein